MAGRLGGDQVNEQTTLVNQTLLLSLVWPKLGTGDQLLSKLGELIPAFDNDSKIDVVRCAMNGQVIDILQEQVSRLCPDNEQAKPLTFCDVHDLANDVYLIRPKLIRQVERCRIVNSDLL